MPAFITDENIVCNGSTRNEGALVGVYNLIQDTFESVGDCACNNLVKNIAEPYRAKIFHRGRVPGLKDKGDDRGVPIFKGVTIVEYSRGCRGKLVTNGVPGILEEQSCKPIGAERFRTIEVEQGLVNIIFGKRVGKSGIHVLVDREGKKVRDILNVREVRVLGGEEGGGRREE